MRIREESRKEFEELGVEAVRCELATRPGGRFDARKREEARAWLGEKAGAGRVTTRDLFAAEGMSGRESRRVDSRRGGAPVSRYVRARAYQEAKRGGSASAGGPEAATPGARATGITGSGTESRRRLSLARVVFAIVAALLALAVAWRILQG